MINDDSHVRVTRVPDWLSEELTKVPDLSDEELQHYDYMRAPFFARLRENTSKSAGRETEGAHWAETVFSCTGAILRFAATIMEKQFPAAAPPILQPVARSATQAPPSLSPPTSGTVVSCVRKREGDFFIELTHYRREEALEVEFNLLDATSAKEIRPFTVEVLTSDGASLVPPTHIGITDQPPRFPEPRAGCYVFKASWGSGTGTLCIQYADNVERLG